MARADSPAEELLTEVIAQAVTPLLKAAGFRKSGTNYHRRQGETVQVGHVSQTSAHVRNVNLPAAINITSYIGGSGGSKFCIGWAGTISSTGGSGVNCGGFSRRISQPPPSAR